MTIIPDPITDSTMNSPETSSAPIAVNSFKRHHRSTKKPTKKLERGGRNLILLGIISGIIAFSTVSVSLLIYHNSGDIYLDRSRPGFLPDEEEVEKNDDHHKDDDDYVFEKSGEITMEVLEDYLEHLDSEIQAIDAYPDPFDPSPLSDSTLGI